MSDRLTDHNATDLDDGTGLRGGTQGGDVPQGTVKKTPGGTNTLSPTGAQAGGGVDTHQGRGTRNDAHQDAEGAFEGTRHPSEAEAKQWGRDAADVDTVPGTPGSSIAPNSQRHHMHEDKA
jgi:hypothetical protein